MNSRAITIVIGVIILLLGLVALIYPERIMGPIGLAAASDSAKAAALGEMRATYGGLFAVMGLFTIFAGVRPATHRLLILFVSLMWLGAAGGRLLGVQVNGTPGLWGWGFFSFEVVVGAALLVAWFGAAAPRREPARTAPPPPPPPPLPPASTPPSASDAPPPEV